MAEKQIKTQFYQVKAPFFFKDSQLFTAGQVVVAGDPVLKGRGHLFEALTPVGAKTAPEPEPEPEPEPDVKPAAEADIEPEPTA